MEENKERKGLFLSGIIVGFAATLLIVGGIFIAFQIHNIVSLKDDVSAQVSYDEDSAVNAQTIKKLQLLEDTVKENFYLSEVTNEQLEDGMFRGLMDSLDDPYSEYYTAEELNAILQPENFTGRSAQQTEEFVAECIQPILDANKELLGEHYEMKN